MTDSGRRRATSSHNHCGGQDLARDRDGPGERPVGERLAGILLPPGAHEALSDYAGTRDGTGKLGHDRGLAIRQARLDRLPGRLVARSAAKDLGRCLSFCLSGLGARFRLVLVQAMHLFLQDTHGLAKRARRGQELLRPEQHNNRQGDDQDFHGCGTGHLWCACVLRGRRSRSEWRTWGRTSVAAPAPSLLRTSSLPCPACGLNPEPPGRGAAFPLPVSCPAAGRGTGSSRGASRAG